MAIFQAGTHIIGAGGAVVSTGIPPPLPGLVLKFDDEFTSFNGNPAGTNGWMTTYAWGGRTGGAGNNEAECYNDTTVAPFIQPFTISGSVLSITASKASVTGTNTLGLPYNSGILVSYNSFFMQYGYFEARVLMPPGTGLWPAFWLLQHDPSFPFPPEIDMMENLGNDMTTIYQNIHFGTSGAPQQTGPAPVTVTDASLNWHVFAVDIEPTNTTFYIDGVQTNQYTTDATTKVPMYILLDLAVGGAGSFPGPPNGATVFPCAYQVDYVRAWASANSTGIGGSLAIP